MPTEAPPGCRGTLSKERENSHGWRRLPGEARGPGQGGRLGLTPVNTGWEVGLGFPPGRSAEVRKSLQALELVCSAPLFPYSISKSGARGPP